MKLNVLGLIITVTEAPIEEEFCRGFYSPVEALIVIDERLSPKEKVQTLIHEVIHAVFDRMSLHQTSISDDIQEMIVDVVATALTENFQFGLRKTQKKTGKTRKRKTGQKKR